MTKIIKEISVILVFFLNLNFQINILEHYLPSKMEVNFYTPVSI